MYRKRTSRTSLIRRLWRFILNPDAAISEAVDAAPSRILTREEQRAFERQERWLKRFIVGLILVGILAPTIFIIVEVYDGFESRERAAREANYIPPR